VHKCAFSFDSLFTLYYASFIHQRTPVVPDAPLDDKCQRYETRQNFKNSPSSFSGRWSCSCPAMVLSRRSSSSAKIFLTYRFRYAP
jgi:hypothetical protein